MLLIFTEFVILDARHVKPLCFWPQWKKCQWIAGSQIISSAHMRDAAAAKLSRCIAGARKDCFDVVMIPGGDARQCSRMQSRCRRLPIVCPKPFSWHTFTSRSTYTALAPFLDARVHVCFIRYHSRVRLCRSACDGMERKKNFHVFSAQLLSVPTHFSAIIYDRK